MSEQTTNNQTLEVPNFGELLLQAQFQTDVKFEFDTPNGKVSKVAKVTYKAINTEVESRINRTAEREEWEKRRLELEEQQIKKVEELQKAGDEKADTYLLPELNEHLEKGMPQPMKLEEQLVFLVSAIEGVHQSLDEEFFNRLPKKFQLAIIEAITRDTYPNVKTSAT